uniref:Uncharacterized protein n=1 Tax=Arundo donax TaxID=35708 RepID=A0A0A9EPZ4_ARUDO
MLTETELAPNFMILLSCKLKLNSKHYTALNFLTYILLITS